MHGTLRFIENGSTLLLSMKTSLGFLDKCILEYLLEVCLEPFQTSMKELSAKIVHDIVNCFRKRLHYQYAWQCSKYDSAFKLLLRFLESGKFTRIILPRGKYLFRANNKDNITTLLVLFCCWVWMGINP